MVAVFLYFSKSNFEVGGSARLLGRTSGKTGLNVENWSFSQGLSRNFSRLSMTHQNALFYTFSDQSHPPKISKASKKF